MLVADGSRRKTAGGVFFTVLNEFAKEGQISRDDLAFVNAVRPHTSSLIAGAAPLHPAPPAAEAAAAAAASAAVELQQLLQQKQLRQMQQLQKQQLLRQVQQL